MKSHRSESRIDRVLQRFNDSMATCLIVAMCLIAPLSAIVFAIVAIEERYMPPMMRVAAVAVAISVAYLAVRIMRFLFRPRRTDGRTCPIERIE